MADQSLNRYVRQRKLGAGAMGEVWLATDTLLNRPVALKYLITPDDARPKQFFLSEAQVLASLNHPNITLIYDAVFDEENKHHYLIMEYVEGKSLSELISGWASPLPLELILDVAIGMLKALQYAHGKGVVHRDIKPGNVMIQGEGVKLTDFGVAGLISLLTEGSDYIVGTPGYMSPEQIQGIGIDGRSDLFSLGVMLYLLTSGGHRPFEYDDLEDMYEAYLDDEPYPLREVVPDLPLALERTIMRLLAKAPEDRYPSAGAVLEIFESIQARLKFSQSHLDLLDSEARPLVGRGKELETIGTVWTDVQTVARPRLLVVRGESGMGKSRLVAEFLGHHVIDQGLIAVAGRCNESGTPYAPYAEILARIIDKGLTKTTVTQNQIDQLLDHIPSLGRLLQIGVMDDNKEAAKESKLAPQQAKGSGLWQALENRVPASTTTTRDPFQTEWQFFATVLTVLTQLGPAAIFLNNASFLDDASEALTRFLIGQEQFPVLFIAACHDSGEPIPWLDTFSAEEKVIVKLPPLTLPLVKEQLTSFLNGPVPDELVSAIHERSQGNPFHIEEMARQLIDTNELQQAEDGRWLYTPSKEIEAPDDSFLPKSVLKAFTRRIEKLTDSSREALALAALIEPGPEFDFDVWLALLGGEAQAETARQMLDGALQKRLLRQIGENRYAFRPTDVAKVLISTLPESRRREAHGRIAELLHPTQADPILVGHHYEQAGLVAEASVYLENAGAKSLAANALNAGLAYYKRAAGLSESQSNYKILGNLYRQQGDGSNSVEALKQALELARQTGDIAGQAEIMNSLSFSLWVFDRYKKAYEYATAVLKLEGAPEAERAIARSHLGMVSWLLGRLAEAEQWCQKAVEALNGRDNEASLAEAHYRLGQVHLSQGKLSEADQALQRSLELYRKLDDDWGQGHSLNDLGEVAIDKGNFEQAFTNFDSARRLFEKLNHRDGLTAVMVNRGRALLDQGQSSQALPLLSKALRLALERTKRSGYMLGPIYLLIARASLELGELDRARTVANDALKMVESAGNQEYMAQAQATLAQIHAAQGDPATAETLYEQALTLFEQVGSRIRLIRAKQAYAGFLTKQGQKDKAASLKAAVRDEAVKIGLYLG